MDVVRRQPTYSLAQLWTQIGKVIHIIAKHDSRLIPALLITLGAVGYNRLLHLHESLKPQDPELVLDHSIV